MSRLLLIIPLLLAGLYCAQTAPARNELPGDTKELSIKIDGLKRTARVYVPAGYDDHALPVILLLHGSGSDGRSVAWQSRMSEAAQNRGFVAIYPDALPLDPEQPASSNNPRVWADGSGRGYSGSHPENDVKFMSQLVALVAREVTIDRSQVHIAGFSNGGSMTFRLATELPGLFHRVAVIAGVSWVHPATWKKQDLLYITGKKDYIIPPDRNIASLPHAPIQLQTSVNQTLLQWMDQCKAVKDQSGHYIPGDLAGRFKQFQCQNHSIEYLELPRTGHVWPGGQEDPVAELDATAVVVRFLLDRKS